MSRKFFFNFAIILMLVSLILFSADKFSSAAEKGIVKGKVTDKKAKVPLPGITVTVEGTDAIAFTDEKGNYSLELPEGTYTIRAELLGYKIAAAKGVVVLSDEPNNINFAMEEFEEIRGTEVVVTGERMDVPLSRTTASVSVVSSEQIKDLAVVGNASDLLTYTPGVQTEGGGSGATKTIKIRGATIAPPKVATAGILLLVDGVPMNDPVSGYASVYMIPSENIDRIEVVKGASSAMYGAQATAGIINIITKKGQKDPRSSFDMSFGTYQPRSNAKTEYIQNYSFSHSWGGEKFDYSISGAYGHSSGTTTAETAPVGKIYIDFGRTHPNDPTYGKPGFGIKKLPDGTRVIPSGGPEFFGKSLNKLMDFDELDNMERYSVNLSLGIKLFKNNTLRINPGYSLLNFGTTFTPAVNPLSASSDVFLLMALNVTNKRDYLNIFDEWKITPKLTYKVRFGTQKTTEGGLFLPVLDYIDYPKSLEALGKKDGFASDTPKNPLGIGVGTTVGKSWNIANDLFYDFDILDGNTILVGQDYQWIKTDAALGKNGGSPQYIKTPLYRRSTAVYLQNTQKAGKFTFTGGGRWEQMTSFIDDFSDEFAPNFGINYELSPGTSFRTSVQRKRRFIEFARTHGLGQSNGVLFGNPAIKPETTWNYEVGFRFLTKYIGGDIAYFYTDYSDTEINIPLNIGKDPGGTGKNHREYMRLYNYIKKYYPFDMPSPKDGLTTADYAKQVFGGLSQGVSYENARAGIFVNGPDVVYQGVDASTDFFLAKNLNMNLSYLFMRATVGNQNPFDFSQGTSQEIIIPPSVTGGLAPYYFGGNRLIYVPTHVFKASTNYTLPWGMRVVASGRFKSTATTISRLVVGGTFRMPEHWIFECKLIQPFFKDKLKLSFSIDNIFSKRYYEDGVIPSSVARYDVGLSWSF